MECYLIILKNNEELLNRRIEDLRIKDTQLRQKEFILNKIILSNKTNPNNTGNTSNPNLNLNNSFKNINNISNIPLENSVIFNDLGKKASNEDLNKSKLGNLSVIVNEDFCLESMMKKTWPENESKAVKVTNENTFTIANTANSMSKNKIQTNAIDVKKKKVTTVPENVSISSLLQKKQGTKSSKEIDKNAKVNKNKTVQNKLFNISHVADLTLDAGLKPNANREKPSITPSKVTPQPKKNDSGLNANNIVTDKKPQSSLPLNTNNIPTLAKPLKSKPAKKIEQVQNVEINLSTISEKSNKLEKEKKEEDVHYEINTNDKNMANNFLDSIINFTKPLANEVIPNQYPTNTYSTREKKAKVNSFLNEVFDYADKVCERKKQECVNETYNNLEDEERRNHNELVEFINKADNQASNVSSSSDENDSNSIPIIENKIILPKAIGLYDPSKSNKFLTPADEIVYSSNNFNSNDDIISNITQEIQQSNKELSKTLVTQALYKDLITVFVDEVIKSDYNNFLNRLVVEEKLKEEVSVQLIEERKAIASGFFNSIFENASENHRRRLEEERVERELTKLERQKALEEEIKRPIKKSKTDLDYRDSNAEINRREKRTSSTQSEARHNSATNRTFNFSSSIFPNRKTDTSMYHVSRSSSLSMNNSNLDRSKSLTIDNSETMNKIDDMAANTIEEKDDESVPENNTNSNSGSKTNPEVPLMNKPENSNAAINTDSRLADNRNSERQGENSESASPERINPSQNSSNAHNNTTDPAKTLTGNYI